MKKIFNSKKITLTITAAIFIVSLFMIIGYSAYFEELFIVANSKITTPEYSIYIKDVEAKYTLNGGYATSTPTYEGTETAMHASLPNLDSGIMFVITIKNNGLTSAVLDHTYISLDNNDIKYKLGDISNGKIVKAGYETIVTVEIYYWDDITAITNSDFSLLIDFEFVPYSNYSDDCTLVWDGSTTSEPSIRNIYGVDYYDISNANEYAWYVNYLNNTSNSAKAILSNNICLNSNSVTQIDTFTGELDGQNRTISGYTVSYSESLRKGTGYYYRGMFKENSGIIKNLNINNTISDSLSLKPSSGSSVKSYDYLGGIVGYNKGKIINTSYSGNITGYYEAVTNCWVVTPVQRNYIGAIVGHNEGIIQGCTNKGTINIEVKGYRNNCTYENETKVNLGGIVGSSVGYVTDSYNNGTLTITSNVKNGFHYIWYGGVIGDLEAGGIANSYNAGTISHVNNTSSTDEYYYIGGVIGNSAGTITNAYYLDSCGQSGSYGTAISSGDLTNINMSIGNYYTKDIRGINGGYPVLKWE